MLCDDILTRSVSFFNFFMEAGHGRVTYLQVPSSRGRTNDIDEQRQIIDRTSLKIAAFPALLPALYDTLRSLSQDEPVLPEVLASTSLLLLPASWRKQLVLYATSSALLQSARSSGLNKHAPPLWTLYILGNAWLLWTFVFNSEAFPKAYTRVVISVSHYYRFFSILMKQ